MSLVLFPGALVHTSSVNMWVTCQLSPQMVHKRAAVAVTSTLSAWSGTVGGCVFSCRLHT